MKILLINDTDKEFGGAEKYLFSLAGLLQENGHQVEVFGSPKFNTKISYISRFYNIGDCFTLKKLLENFQPDIVHIHKINLALSSSILRVIKKFNIPIVMTVHDFHYVCPDDWLINSKNQPCYQGFNFKCIFSNCYRSKISWKYKGLRIYHVASLFIHRRMLKKYVDMFIVPSNALARMMMENLHVDNICVIRNAIKLNFDYSDISVTDSKKLLYIGRLSKEKGVQYIIRSMPKILELFPESELIIVGTGPEREALEKLVVDLGVTGSVCFAGFVKEDRLADYYHKSEIVVVPSYWAENNPIVCLEAMAYGRPIVASNLFGLAEVIENDDIGILFDPGNPLDLAHKVIFLMSDFNKVQMMSTSAVKKYSIYGSFNDHYHKIMQIYNIALGIQ